MNDECKNIINNIDYKSLLHENVGNGIYLTKEEMNILSNYKINYENCSSVSELIYEIEDILENIESDELEFILDELSEYKYYNETNK